MISLFFYTLPHARSILVNYWGFSFPYRVNDYATDHRALRGFWHDMTCKGRSSYFLHECRPVTMAACGVSLWLVLISLQPDTSHTPDGQQRSCHGFSSMLCRSVYALQGHGHISHIAYSPASHAPHKTYRLSALDSRGMNTAASVSLAYTYLRLSINKALRDRSHKAILYFVSLL